MVIHNSSGCVACICTGYESDEMDCMSYVDKYQESLALLDVGYSVSDAETDEGADQESLVLLDVGHSVSDAETDEGSDQESLALLDVGHSVSDAETDEGSDQESLASSDVGHNNRTRNPLNFTGKIATSMWLSFITSTKFKLMYEDKELYTVHFVDQVLTIDHGTIVEFPFNISRVNTLAVVCLTDDDGDTSRSDTITLCNPSICEFKQPNTYYLKIEIEVYAQRLISQPSTNCLEMQVNRYGHKGFGRPCDIFTTSSKG
ncbi:hypothetical protein OSB04_013106 [Centaurea solstitialis]|uniref:Uncharacterized protein n=1 Tax=Centaurea solstitialis TaxID=347529 RepID=A0AA38TVN4_9ASTR|nr:hypothetical protein OSB04_013106 [Centaurea solstitialis]